MKQFMKSDLLHALPDQFFAALTKKVAARMAAGHDVINLGQGNPDLPTPPHIIERLKKAAENPMNHKYPPFRGQNYLKQAVASFYKREHGVELDGDTEVAILFGGKAGLVELPLCLTNPGDTVLVPDPGYPDYWSGVELAKAEMLMMPLEEKNDFLPDYSLIPIDKAEKAKLMFINYPNNPTGAIANEAFFEETIQFANEHDICVVHDFAYGSIGFDGKKPLSYLQFPGAKETGIEIYTLSKTFNMAGWRVGFAVGNPSVIDAINLYQDHLYVSIFGAIQEAAEEALLSSFESAEKLRETYESRRNVLIAGLQSIDWEVTAPKGSFFAWLKVPNDFTSVTFSDYLLERANVVVAPGVGFGQYGEGYVRVGLLTSEERIVEAVERIKKLGLF
ncbi:pyridoxal phosphate-dependent aminotransferase [Jeotgalibacillus soli]|uniref:Diaminopimelate aminotransferase n=1 Tax=Jeotgalibacillus soli TaxID=889306 RepID=A0A0C2VPC9_9BACL|nr:pyridoxal phosphate-dependent aminotransferase [Jeotgalibacillus soli]KIL45868.1 diaminopimelate aminotransferase [Jeotgalibacillus soli]